MAKASKTRVARPSTRRLKARTNQAFLKSTTSTTEGILEIGNHPSPLPKHRYKKKPMSRTYTSSDDNKTRTLTQFCLEGYTVRSLHLPRDTPGPGILRSLMGYYHHTRVPAQPVCHQDSNPSRRPDNNQAKSERRLREEVS